MGETCVHALCVLACNCNCNCNCNGGAGAAHPVARVQTWPALDDICRRRRSLARIGLGQAAQTRTEARVQ